MVRRLTKYSEELVPLPFHRPLHLVMPNRYPYPPPNHVYPCLSRCHSLVDRPLHFASAFSRVILSTPLVYPPQANFCCKLPRACQARQLGSPEPEPRQGRSASYARTHGTARHGTARHGTAWHACRHTGTQTRARASARACGHAGVGDCVRAARAHARACAYQTPFRVHHEEWR